MLGSLIAILFLLLISSTTFAMEVQDIVAKANHISYYQGTDGRAKVKMTIVDKQGRERSRGFTIIRLDINDKVDREQRFYVLFKRPADVSKTAFLVWKHPDREDDRWLYLPALDLVRRIAASDVRTSFVGSHFFYEDVSGRVPEKDRHELESETQQYYILRSVPKEADEVEFGWYRSWIHKASFIPVKIEYYNKHDSLYRTYEALGVDNVQGYATVTRSKMSDKKMGGYTTLEYSKLRYDEGFKENIFSERYLRNPPRQALRY